MQTPLKRKGSALMIALWTTLTAITLCLALLTQVTGSTRLSYRSWQKAQANALAQSGVEQMYAQVANAYANQTTDSNPIPPTSVVGTIGGSSQSDGSYSANVVSSSSSLSGYVTINSYVIQGAGTSPDGIAASKKVATFSMSTNAPLGSLIADEAIRTAGNVNMSGGSFTTDPTGTHAASVSANGSITDSSPGLTIDGMASYFKPSALAGKARSTQQLASQMTFPPAATTTNWRSMWLAQSQQPTATYPAGNIVVGNLTVGSPAQTITAPMYIGGNLNVPGGHQLTVAVDPSASKPCVLFVHGTITVSGGSALQNKGVVIVSDGNMTFSGGSNVYGVTDMTDSGLICYSADPLNAINISGKSGSAQVGMIYAINGGATLSGGSSFNGSLTCGGLGSTVTLSGGSSIAYQPGFNNTNGPFVAKWVASSLSKWVSLQ